MNNNEKPPLFFKRVEALALSITIAVVAFTLECLVLFSEGGSRGKLLVAIPVIAFIIVRSISKNTRPD